MNGLQMLFHSIFKLVENFCKVYMSRFTELSTN